MLSNKEVIQQINDSFTVGDIDKFLSFCTEDFQWIIVGSKTLTGKQEVIDFMNTPGSDAVPELSVITAFADGNLAASEGTMKMKNKEGEMVESAFCDVYLFEGNLVKELRSYIIDVKK